MNPEEIKIAIELRGKGLLQREIAEKLNVSQQSISKLFYKIRKIEGISPTRELELHKTE